jgi:hypothetical protein
MVPNLHPEQAKALYREIANDTRPAPIAPPYLAGSNEDGEPMSPKDEEFWMAVIGAAFLFGVVLIVAAVRGLA